MKEFSIREGTLEVTGNAIITIADGSSVTVTIKPEKDSTIELRVGSNCRVNSFVIQEKEAGVIQTNYVGSNSILHSQCLWLSECRGKVFNRLEGTGSQAYDLHIFVGKGSEKLQLDAVLRHIGKDTKGNILVKGIVKDSAMVKLDGMIKIDKDGSGANSLLSEHVMLLNPGAHAEAKPELEIENDDVSSTHTASVSQIDEDKIFYLTSRGMSKEDARKLIIEGFLESGIKNVQDEAMRKQFREKAFALL
jgi:Fe-S cluster assembly scaffold protein SufB